MRLVERPDFERMTEVVRARVGLIVGEELDRAYQWTMRQLSGRALKVRTGTLRRSLRKIGPKLQGSAIKAGLGFTRSGFYAVVHEEGRHIKPRRARKLAIPLAAAKTPAGVPKGRPRDFPNTFIQRSGRGNLLIFQKRGAEIVPLFALKDRVYVPPRLFMRAYLRSRMAPAVLKRISREVPEAVERMGAAHG